MCVPSMARDHICEICREGTIQPACLHEDGCARLVICQDRRIMFPTTRLTFSSSHHASPLAFLPFAPSFFGRATGHLSRLSISDTLPRSSPVIYADRGKLCLSSRMRESFEYGRQLISMSRCFTL